MSEGCWFFELRAPDGVSLRVREYSSDRLPDASWNVVIVHGLAEHGGRYDHVARRLMESGHRVIVPDLRGHGRSGGIRTDVRDFDQYVADLRQIFDALRLEPHRTVLMGHSMGGLVAARFCERHPDAQAALVALGPLLKIRHHVPAWKLALGHVCRHLLPTVRFKLNLASKSMTHDAGFLERRRADPFMQSDVTARWFFASRRAIDEAFRDAARIKVPVLIMQGEDDRVVGPEGAADWVAQLSHANFDVRMLPAHLHELLHEPDWEMTLQEITRWVRQQLTRAYVPPTRHLQAAS